jgi:hypothetical protein
MTESERYIPTSRNFSTTGRAAGKPSFPAGFEHKAQRSDQGNAEDAGTAASGQIVHDRE